MSRGGYRKNSGRKSIDGKIVKVRLPSEIINFLEEYGFGSTLASKVRNRLKEGMNMSEEIRFIDLFAGLGGTRLGFEAACDELGVKYNCVFTSEIKSHAITALEKNFPKNEIHGDITQIDAIDIPDFDVLLAGFPCQSFSFAGKGLGFLDTRGTLFFDIERVLRQKKPKAFILENVEGLVLHDRESIKDKTGKTLRVILDVLNDLGYFTNWEVLDSKYFGVAQSRKRVYIVGTLKEKISLTNFKVKNVYFGMIKETGLPVIKSEFTQQLLKNFSLEELQGKSIKDKRGGDNNIHSWDIGIKGNISNKQKQLLNVILKERRKKHWANKIGIDWMDGMPLTADQIFSFYPDKNLTKLLDDVVEKGYLTYEYPKKLVRTEINGKIFQSREYDITKPKGYNIVSGKLSFEFSEILNDDEITPTLVATDLSKIGVIDGVGIRKLSLREGLRLFGYPETYSLEFLNSNEKIAQGYDLLGNTVVVNVIKSISSRVLSTLGF